jgi:hypothetical protein
MPTPRKHSSAAEKQRAYRQRQEHAHRELLAAKGLPPLPVIPTMPGERRWAAMLEQTKATLRTMLDEMQAYQDERSEEWQESDRGEALRERIAALEAIADEADALS